MIHLYAFVDGLAVLDDPELDRVDAAGIDAIVGAELGSGDDAAVRHGLVAQMLVDAADAVLPVRFGERFADEAALAAAVAPRADALRQRLADVRGCVELTVRVAADRADLPAASDGVSYMRARLLAYESDAALSRHLADRLRHVSRAAVVADARLSRLVHDGCYLVRRQCVDEFARAVGDYAAEHPDLNVMCTGPWAPASFAEAPA